MLLIACLALFVIGSAQAVHDEGFQLDGNTAASCPPSPDTGLCTASQKDWNDLFDVTTTSTTETVANSSAVTGAFTQATFTRDFQSGASCSLTSSSTTFCTGDDTTFATGSKDTLDISAWECNHDNNVNSKIDIMNAYAAAYTDPTSGDKLMYFGLEKNKDNGTNDVGFWFLQGNASCSAPSGHKPWTGTHTVGDVLVVSEFTNGGGVSNITAYRWVGGNIPLVQIGTAGDCKGQAGGDNLCATTNSGTKQFNTKVATPWLTSDATLGVGRNQIVSPDFFEGGINLTRAFQSSGSTAPSCFNTFIADTRSSNVTSSTLFDFARGQLGQCQSSLSTQQNAVVSPATSISIGTGTVSSGTDTATLNITGSSTWGGTLDFYLCGPSATVCDVHGFKVGSSTTVSSADSSHAYTSGSTTLTSAGDYCWHAHFTPNTASSNAGIQPADDNGAHECFTVSPVTPTLTTTATCSASPCVVGSTLRDTAALSGTASAPGNNGAGGDTGLYKSINATNGAAAGGTINWSAYGPNDCSTAVTLGANSATVSGNGTYPTTSPSNISFTATVVGTYTFVASYTGDSPNTNNLAASACPDPVNGTEHIAVSGNATIASAQRWLPNDRVVVSGDANLNGTLTVTLYPTSNCTGTAVSGQTYTKTFSNDTSPQVFNTGNSTYFVGTNSDGTAGGSSTAYSWKVHYADTGLNNPSDHCESSSLTISD